MMCDLDESQKVRVLLAQALFGNPDILLLDEPTNHLDIPAKEALESALEKYDGTELCYSLDQNNKVLEERKDLRNQVLDTILELHNRFIVDSTDLKEDEGE